VLCKGRVIFTQYIPKTDKQFGIKLELCNSKRYRPTHNMTVYLSKDERSMTPSMTDAHATVTRLTARLENMVHKLYMDNFF